MKYILPLFLILYSYACIRYHLGKKLGVEYIVFVFNKAIAWAAAICLGLSVIKFNRPFIQKKTFGIYSFTLGFIHVILTLFMSLFDFYPTLFHNSLLTGSGFFVLLSGIMTFLLMIFPLLSSMFPNKYPDKWIKIGKIALFINFFHPIIIGFKNWWPTATWPLFLPPITLLISLIYTIILLIYWKQKRAS
ncbi:MAG: hypothetical protein ACKO6A_01095 [Bacteroidota bacterium]